MNTTERLLIAAGVLMLLAGCIMGILKLRLCGVLLGVGGLCCLLGAVSFKNRDNKGE